MTEEDPCVASTPDTKDKARRYIQQTCKTDTGKAWVDLCSGERRLTTRHKSHGRHAYLTRGLCTNPCSPISERVMCFSSKPFSPRQLQREEGRTRPGLHCTALHSHTKRRNDFSSTPTHHTQLHHYNFTHTAALKEKHSPKHIILNTPQRKVHLM